MISFTQLRLIIIRACLMLFWVAVIFIGLYIPDWADSLWTKRTINVLGWPLVFDARFLSEFEEKHNVTVRVNYFENNEELLMKMETTGGKGYDLIMPSDYMVPILAKKGLIKKFDTKKLSFLPYIYEHLKGHYFDPHNEYSVPFFWGVYGLGIDKGYFSPDFHDYSWKLVFEKQSPSYCIGIVDEQREVVLIAAQYLFGSIDNLSDAQLEQIKKLLLKQKKWVAMYSEMRADSLLITKACPVIVIVSADLARAMRYIDTIDFVIPKEGGFMSIDNFALPSATQQDELVHELLNFVYSKKILQEYVDHFGFFSPRIDVKSEEGNVERIIPTPEQIKKMAFFHSQVPISWINNVWIELKS